MPRRDGTGPNGQGSFTGKGFGKCLAYGIPAVAGAIAVFGFGRGRGFGGGFARGLGRGLGQRFFNLRNEKEAASPEEIAVLKDKAATLEKDLNNLRKHISESESK